MAIMQLREFQGKATVLQESLDCVIVLNFKQDNCLFFFPSLRRLQVSGPAEPHNSGGRAPCVACPPALRMSVPSVPPAAEPVPHLQTPNSDPQTMARECPQSSKPPSGSKSGLRNTPGCLHASDSKTVGGHSHPKQQRISRRRATNGWIPVGTACEKAVYVVVGVWSAVVFFGFSVLLWVFCVCVSVSI